MNYEDDGDLNRLFGRRIFGTIVFQVHELVKTPEINNMDEDLSDGIFCMNDACRGLIVNNLSLLMSAVVFIHMKLKGKDRVPEILTSYTSK